MNIKIEFLQDRPVRLSTESAYVLLTGVGGLPAIEYMELLPFGEPGNSVVVPRGYDGELTPQVSDLIEQIRAEFTTTPQVTAWLDALETGRSFIECLATRLAHSMDEAYSIQKKMLDREARVEAKVGRHEVMPLEVNDFIPLSA